MPPTQQEKPKAKESCHNSESIQQEKRKELIQDSSSEKENRDSAHELSDVPGMCGVGYRGVARGEASRAILRNRHHGIFE